MSTGTALNWLPNCVHGLVHKTNQKVRGSEAGANSIQIKKSRSLPLQSPTLFDETPLQVVKELRLGQGIRDIKRRSHGPFAINISNYYKEAKVKKKKTSVEGNRHESTSTAVSLFHRELLKDLRHMEYQKFVAFDMHLGEQKQLRRERKGTWTSFLARSETNRLRLHSIQWHNSQSSPAEKSKIKLEKSCGGNEES